VFWDGISSIPDETVIPHDLVVTALFMGRHSLVSCLWEQGIPRECEVGEAVVLHITTPAGDYSWSSDDLLNNSNSSCMRVICK